MLGRILADRYRIHRKIGEGGMGAVYLCEHVILHRPLAVKVLRRELSSDPEIVERFRNEAIAASQIGQENVVDVFDIGKTDDGALYYVMEALDGQSVGAVLRTEGPLAVPRALAILEHVCRALGAAHARGVVHRDLKPDNVFVVRRDDGTEVAKLLDFGISKLEQAGERLTQAGAIIGTPEYMAPEQAAGAAVDARTDVYGLGVMAYEMLTGVLPFEGDNAIATLVAHQTRPPEAPSRRRIGVPPEVDALVLRALAKRPEDRFDTMNALVAEIVKIRARLGSQTPEPGSMRPLGVTPRIDLPPYRPSVRGETVSLPKGGSAAAPLSASGVRGPAWPRSRGARLGAGAAAVGVLVVLAALVGWWLRGIGQPAPTAPWPRPFPVAPPAAHAPADDRAAAPAPSNAPEGEGTLSPDGGAARDARAGRAPGQPSPKGPKDPYGPEPRRGGDLKPSPFE